MQKFPMTVQGHAALETELKHLKTVERPEIINAIAVARDHGDLKENAEYHAAKEKQGFTLRKKSRVLLKVVSKSLSLNFRSRRSSTRATRAPCLAIWSALAQL